ncbi:MAG: Asparaginase [Rhodospirillales bacterium]|nr:Asparaginase [Rhodospirillales bacterium]
MPKLRIAHLAGGNATIQNTPPLVTSNKARRKHNLPLIEGTEEGRARYDVLRPQRLAAPVTVYVEQFSAHPLEADAAELYCAPDGYVDVDGKFHKERRSPADRPVYEIELRPEDGVYPMPYMARQADGRPWEEECTDPFAPDSKARQGFFPDGSRSFEEIDRLCIGANGLGNLILSKADIDFHRIIPPAGYRKGLPAASRTDVGEGDIPPEVRGRDFFPYKPRHLNAAPPMRALASIVNKVQKIVSSDKYDGAIWTQGSPRIEETSYWLNLLIDTTIPICANAAQRPHGQISNDGPQNLVDSVDYIASKVWADPQGRNLAGFVLVQDQQIYASRDVTKIAARPGGYISTSGQSGVLGTFGHDGPVLHYAPMSRHTHCSEVRVTVLPSEVAGVRMTERGIATVPVAIKNAGGDLLETAIPEVAIVKNGNYIADDLDPDVAREVDLIALIEHRLRHAPLAGFVIEGLAPYGSIPSVARNKLMLRAAYSGMPVVCVGRGNPQEAVPEGGPFVAGSNLTSTKARLLLMACLMRFGSMPVAHEPDNPTADEKAATAHKVKEYQAVFHTH